MHGRIAIVHVIDSVVYIHDGVELKIFSEEKNRYIIWYAVPLLNNTENLTVMVRPVSTRTSAFQYVFKEHCIYMNMKILM